MAKKTIRRKKVVKTRKIAKTEKAADRTKVPQGKKMPRKELKFYKGLLLKDREKIGGDLSHIAHDSLNRSQRDASGDLSGYSYHMADVASDNYEMEFSLGRASDEQDFLYRIDEALARVEDGTYGNCQQCSKPIAKKRLKALPHTALCIDCQKRNEGK